MAASRVRSVRLLWAGWRGLLRRRRPFVLGCSVSSHGAEEGGVGTSRGRGGRQGERTANGAGPSASASPRAAAAAFFFRLVLRWRCLSAFL
jgi:hypothetical protein